MHAGTVSAVATLQKLATKVLLPLIAGQLLRPMLLRRGVLTGRKKILSRTSETYPWAPHSHHAPSRLTSHVFTFRLSPLTSRLSPLTSHVSPLASHLSPLASRLLPLPSRLLT